MLGEEWRARRPCGESVPSRKHSERRGAGGLVHLLPAKQACVEEGAMERVQRGEHVWQREGMEPREGLFHNSGER